MSVKWVLIAPLLMVFLLDSASSGNVLVWPADYSHWINVKFILHELTAKGHQVTVLLPSYFQAANSNASSPFQLEVIPVPFSKEDMDALLEDFFYLWYHDQHDKPFWEFSIKLYDFIMKFYDLYKLFCDEILLNQKMLQKLESAAFDVLISDPIISCGELLAEKLHVPVIYSLRFSFGNTMERLCGGLPAPPSYVPASLGGLTDRMSFMERMTNMLFYLSQDMLFHQVFFKYWNKYYSDVLGKNSFPVPFPVFLMSTS
ncbi:hypothetical protein JD844_002448 [Phrynosoma platyrhinos]|uniref:Uncharacterized protein n=1 Tax=Phrynosoma platyrhinos TaxID=52577 RepID=A0ABQ7TBG1_PHRPL|nr:hypothetical protein JD844_002448 [Phrynosoma platyrhinos]